MACVETEVGFFVLKCMMSTSTYLQMDEEDLYSAVGRQAYAAEPDEQDAGQEDDSMNDDTFGAALVSAANNGIGPARPAWTSAGASVALVAGSNRWLILVLPMHMP